MEILQDHVRERECSWIFMSTWHSCFVRTFCLQSTNFSGLFCDVTFLDYHIIPRPDEDRGGRKFANNNLRVCALLYTHLHHKLTSAQRKHFIELLTYHIIVLCLGTVYGHSFYFSFAGHGRTFDIWCVCWWPKLAQSHLHPTSMASRKAMMKKDDLVGQILGKTMRKRAKTLTSTMGTALKKPFTGQKMGHYIVYLQSKDTNIKHP